MLKPHRLAPIDSRHLQEFIDTLRIADESLSKCLMTGPAAHRKVYSRCRRKAKACLYLGITDHA